MSLFGGRSFVHLDADLQKIRRDIGEEHRAHQSAGDQRNPEHQEEKEHRQRGVAPPQAAGQKREVDPVYEAMQPLAEEPLEANKDIVRIGAVVLYLHVRQVGGKNQLGFDD